jgi:hypothetical protein
MQGMGTTAAWQDGTEWRAFRDHEFTYAIYHRDRKELLFHHRRDPLQLGARHKCGESGGSGPVRPVVFEPVAEATTA